jgi:hypothetical protein
MFFSPAEKSVKEENQPELISLHSVLNVGCAGKNPCFPE